MLLGRRLFGEVRVRLRLELLTSRNGVHLGSHATEFKLSAVANFLPCQSCAQCQRELFVEQFWSDPRVSLRAWNQHFFKPLLLLFNRLRGDFDRLEQPVALGITELGHLRTNGVLDDRQHAAILLESRLGMDERNTLGIERGPDLFKQFRELLQPSRHAGEPFLNGSELTRHQSIDRAARKLCVGDRVPRPLLQRIEPPEIALQLMVQQSEIDLLIA